MLGRSHLPGPRQTSLAACAFLVSALYPLMQQHAMVCSFVTSAEYQLRFGAAVTRNNSECPQ